MTICLKQHKQPSRPHDQQHNDRKMGLGVPRCPRSLCHSAVFRCASTIRGCIKDDNQLQNIDLFDLREACKILRSIIRYHHVPLLTVPQLGSIYKIQFSYATISDRLIHANSTNQNIVFCICEFVHQYVKALMCTIYSQLPHCSPALLDGLSSWHMNPLSEIYK